MAAANLIISGVILWLYVVFFDQAQNRFIALQLGLIGAKVLFATKTSILFRSSPPQLSIFFYSGFRRLAVHKSSNFKKTKYLDLSKTNRLN
jgi:hypothetical protein